MIVDRFNASTGVFIDFLKNFKIGKSTRSHLITGIFRHLFNVINRLRPVNLKDHRIKSGDDGRVECTDQIHKIDILLKGLDVVRQYAVLFERRVQSSTRVKKVQVVTRQANHIISILPQCAPDATGFLSDVYKRSTRAQKFLADGVQCGRSMIEMLGVLAIIGVLSVGGIAGYSKAMFIWKSNVQRNMLTELISGLIRFQSYSLPNIDNRQEIDLTPMFGEMGLLPEGTEYDNDWIQDKYGVKAQVGYSHYYRCYFIRLYYIPTEGDGISPYQELCRNVVQVTKPLANIIGEIRSWTKDSENASYSVIYKGQNLATETVEETNRKCKNVAFGKHMTIIFKF